MSTPYLDRHVQLSEPTVKRMAEMQGPNWLESVFSFVKLREVVHVVFEAHAVGQGRDLFFFNSIIELINSIAANP